MVVLSDDAIRKLIADGKLIRNGDPKAAKHCAYEFKAGRIVYGGIAPPSSQIESIDLRNSTSTTAAILPSGVAWIQSQERVVIPADVVGMWVQTNSLSRRGLLLLNSTLVEPGYDGYLSALFVNFGSSPVVVSGETTIAKLVFFNLDGEAIERVDSSKYSNYDAVIDTLAAQSSRTFLRINELIPDIGKAVDGAVSDAKQQIVSHSTTSLEKAKEELADLRKETFLKVGGGFTVGLALAFAFTFWMFPKIRTIDAESRDRITEIVLEQNSELAKQLKEVRSELDVVKSNFDKRPATSPSR